MYMARRLITFIFIVLLCATALALSSCGFVEAEDVNLHFVIDGTSFRDVTRSAFLSTGLDVGEKMGYVFDGWYIDSSYTQYVNPGKVTADTTLYGRWVKEQIKTNTFTITFVMDDGTFVGTRQAASVGDIVYPAAPPKDGYVFGEWTGKPAVLTENVTITGVYRRVYVVTFRGEDDEELSVERVPDGSFATPPIPPKKEGDEEYSYEFAGWVSDEGDYNDVRQDMVVHATYDAITNRYTYTLHLQNGQADYVRTVEYGTQITLPSPTKDSTEDKTYTFLGWDVDEDGVKDDVKNKFRLYADFEAWALYEEAARYYTVTFDVDGATTEAQTTYRAAAAYPEETAPTRAATAEFTFAFVGWDTDEDGIADEGLASVEGDLVAVAVFGATVNRYTYRFALPDGTAYGEETTAPYGTPIELPEVSPEKEATDSYAYTFSHWSGYEEGMTLAADVTFVAVFNMHVRLYIVSFKYKGQTLASYKLSYGTVIDYDEAIKPYPYPLYPDEDDKAYAYSWNNWTPDYVVTKDITFTLDKNSNYDYVVTWQVEEGRSFDTYYCAGDVLALPKQPTRDGYEFVCWQDYDASLRVQSDMTVVAVWREVQA